MAEDPLKIRERFLHAYDQYADAIFRHCYFRLSDRELAKDSMQEAFLRTWEYMSEKGIVIDNIRAFLYRVANHIIVDSIRKKKPSSLDYLLEEGFQPVAKDEKIAARIDGKDALHLLAKLPAESREVVVMRYIDDLTPHEIAEVLSVSPNVVSVRLNRALEKLRTLFPDAPSR